MLCLTANAVVVRGHVTDALGHPVMGARVQLIAHSKVVALGVTDDKGAFEIRSTESGRFTLLTSAAGLFPAEGTDFYGGPVELVLQDVVLNATTLQQQVTVTATGLPTPLPQLTAPLSIIPEQAFSTRVGVIDEMRQTPGVFLVQEGQTGTQTSLFVRGGNSTANLVLIDGIPADDVGGTFDFGTVSSTAVTKLEIDRGPNSAIYGTDAGAAVVSIDTPRGYTLQPLFTYSGDGGNLNTFRNEATVGGAFNRLDYFGAFSRFDTSNALPLDKYHSGTAAINLGYDFKLNTQARLTLRNADSVSGLPDAHDFYGISSDGRESDQDLYSGLTVENKTESGWHNLVRYGIARKREQAQSFGNVGTPIPVFGFTEYFGDVVTIRGANGYSATGQAAFFNPADDEDSNRDQLYYQSDYAFSPHFVALFGFRYDKERGSFNDIDFGDHEKVQRTNFEYNAQLQGELFHKLFYSAGGSVEKNHLYGIAGVPKLGLSYVPVAASNGLFHGTRLRFNFAKGLQEPTLALQFASLYTQLLEAGDTADIALYNIGPQAAERSRTYDFGVDQNVLGESLVFKAGYFHNVFDRQLEGVTSEALQQYFGITLPPADNVYDAYLNSLAYRAQGAELELEWKPKQHLFVRGGYTFLATNVLQSFASDAVNANQGMPTENPNLPGIAIGAESPLVGARVFRRPPNTGFFDVQYMRPKWTVALKGALASRSDDSTYLDYSDTSDGNSLILPNRDLDFGYAKLDLSGTYAIKRYASVFAQIDNLLNDQHIGPIGYPGLPLTFRAGIKLRLGGSE